MLYQIDTLKIVVEENSKNYYLHNSVKTKKLKKKTFRSYVGKQESLKRIKKILKNKKGSKGLDGGKKSLLSLLSLQTRN